MGSRRVSVGRSVDITSAETIGRRDSLLTKLARGGPVFEMGLLVIMSLTHSVVMKAYDRRERAPRSAIFFNTRETAVKPKVAVTTVVSPKPEAQSIFMLPSLCALA